MKIFEVESTSAEEQHVKRLKDNAKNARVRAKQMDAQAKLSAAQLRAKNAKVQAAAASTLPKLPALGKPSWSA